MGESCAECEPECSVCVCVSEMFIECLCSSWMLNEEGSEAFGKPPEVHNLCRGGRARGGG